VTSDQREEIKADLAGLQAGHLGKELFAFFWIDNPEAPQEQMSRTLPQHLRFLHELEARGILFASGPLRDDPGVAITGGLTVIRADSFESAHVVMAPEPYVKAGLRTYQLRKWTLNEGRIDVHLNLSNSTFSVG